MQLCWHRCFETLRGARIWVLHDSRDLGDAHVERREFPVRNWGEERMEEGSHGVCLGDFIQLCWRRVILQTSEGEKVHQVF